MHWIENRSDERKNIFKYFPEVKSVISFGYNYYTDENGDDELCEVCGGTGYIIEEDK